MSDPSKTTDSSSAHHSGAKKYFDKGMRLADKYVGGPSNKLAGKMGMESFWPTTMDRELDKAARILRVFTLDGGVQSQENVTDADGHKKKQHVIKKIPPKVIAEAKGIAIFTVFRTGLHWSAASGSGVVLARLPDGSWSPPSGILLHILSIGLVVGIDIYDVVLILNTEQAVNQFRHARVKLGGEVSVAAGPVGSGAGVDASRAGSYSYTKSKGFYAGLALDGQICIERGDENERFYGQRLKAEQILMGQPQKPALANGLYETLAAAEGRSYNREAIPNGMGPSEEHHEVDQKLVSGEGQNGAPPAYDDATSGK